MGAKGHTQAIKLVSFLAALLLLCPFVSLADVSPCGDSVTLNGNTFTWSGIHYDNGSDIVGYVVGGVGGYCSGTLDLLGFVNAGSGNTGYYERSGGVWAHCSGADEVTSFDFGSCGSYGGGGGGSPTPTPTATSQDVVDSIHYLNIFVVFACGLMFTGILTRNVGV